MKTNPNAPPNTADTRSFLRFSPELEPAFQKAYYRNLVPGLRGGMLVFVLVHLLLAVYFYATHGFFRGAFLPEAAVGTTVFLLTFWTGFRTRWQPAIFTLFGGLIIFLLITQTQAGAGTASDASADANRLQALMRPGIPVIVYGFVLTRVQFRWFLPGALLILALGVAVSLSVTGLPVLPILTSALLGIGSPLAALVYTSYVQEQTSRRGFMAQYLLAQERNSERRLREQSEAKLSVLGQAIGGIVHDLGNPLATVYTGAATLQTILAAPQPNIDAAREFAGMIHDGAEMLNFLRLSLLEQTRVLENKPIPVDLQTASVKTIVERGARFQNPRFVSRRTITLPEETAPICADSMKLTTVFMNLIGNALKYSTGEVRVLWQTHDSDSSDSIGGSGNDKVLLVAVLDQGTGGKGITQAQARQLFVPFGRLEVHGAVEGTGLGLLSVRKIVEAHGGEVFIEGTMDGTPSAPRFTTAMRATYPSLLTEPFRTAFVVTCPAACAPHKP